MKKFSALLICLLMIVTCSLAGCATFSIDKVKYYNEVLATVDQTKITRFDLLTAYNSYGNSYYVQQMGQSEEEALKSTLDLLIDRELMYQYALDNGNKYKPTEYQINEVVKQIFESVDSQMDSYIENLKNIYQIESETIPTDAKEDQTAYKFEDYIYTPRAEVKDKIVYYTDHTYQAISPEETNYSKIEYYIEYIVPEEETNYEKLIDSQYLSNFTSSNAIEEIKDKYFAHFYDKLKLNEGEHADLLYSKARYEFAKSLINYEYYLRDSKGKPYSTDNESLFYRYFDRTFKSQIQSQYLENVRTYYLSHETLSLELLVDEYKYLVTNDYNRYKDDFSSYKDKMKNISTSGDSVLYHPTTDAQFGYFIHTLISFDSIKDNLTLLEEIKDKDEYKTEYNKLIGKVTVKARDAETGLIPEDAEEINVQDVINEYNSIKNATYSNDSEKMAKFIEFMFKYTSDSATLKQGMPYVVGTNGYSAMVEEFNDEAIKLMTGKDKDGKFVMEAKPGNMSSASMTDIDNLCITQYGIHLLYYVGDVNTFDIPYNSTIYIQSDDKDLQGSYNLYSKVINPLTKKTYFDKMFDLVYPASSGEVFTSNNGYTDFEERITAESKSNHQVTKYTTKINATKTNIN